ncbi:MAG: metallophosphoesterase family protein [Pseudomonadota bacterium]
MLGTIGIIGDVHAEDTHLEQAITTLNRAGAEVLLCTGDIADGSGSLERCVDMLREFEVITVRGNHDRWVLQNKARHIPKAHFLDQLSPAVIEYLTNLPTSRTVDTSNGKLLLCHGVADHDLQKVWPGTARMPVERSTRLDEIIKDGKYRWMINGHVHYRTVIHFETLTLINAGTLLNRHKPGFSMMNLEEGFISGYEFRENQAPVEVKQIDLEPSPDTKVFENTQHFDGDWDPITLYA